MLARLAGEIRDALARPDSGVTVAGRPLEEVTDPFVLEVHRPVQPEDAPPGLPVLPPYVPREHDQVLGQVVRAAADGRSGIAVLVGGSSTGKTRACWEALALLRDQDPPWRLWHPIDPSRPDAALAELPGIGPRTVVWLNEAQFYLDPAEAGLGERVAAGLRELLRDPGRAPVLVLATVWPGFWDALTARPAGGEDRHAQARELLAGHDITVPAAFTPAQMSQLAQAADVRMVLAARSAPDGEVIQFLAGAPELLARYRNAPPAAAALIRAAMDARRLGMGVGPAAGLPGSRRAGVPDRRPVGRPRRGLAGTGPGLRRRPVQGRPRAADPHPPPPGQARRPPPRGPARQHGCRRGAAVPARGLPGPARPGAPRRPDPPGGVLVRRRRARRARRPGRARRRRPRPRPVPGRRPAAQERRRIRQPPRRPLPQPIPRPACARTPAPRTGPPPTPPSTTRTPWPACWTACGGRARDEQAAALLARDPAAHAALDDPAAVAPCWTACGRRARTSRPPRWPARAAAHAPLDDPGAVAPAGQPAGGGRATSRPPRCWPAIPPPTPPSTTRAVARLLDSLRAAGADEQAAALAGPGRRPRPPRRPGRRGRPAGQPAGGGRGRAGRRAGRPGPAAHAPLDNPGAWPPAGQPAGGGRGRAGRRAGQPGRRPRPPRRPGRRGLPAGRLREAGADEQAAALAGRAAAHAPLDDPGGVAWLLDSLREAGAHEQAAALAGPGRRPRPPRRPGRAWPACWAACGRRARTSRPPRCWPATPPPTPPSTTRAPWPGCWPACGRRARDEQAAALAGRAAAHAPLDNPGAVARLLGSLREAGAHEQAAALAGRLPAAGMFGLFLEQEASRISSVSDGRPTAPRPRHGAGKTWTYGLFLGRGDRRHGVTWQGRSR